MRSGLPAETCVYVSADLRRDPVPAELSDPRLRLLCLVERTVDEIVHGNVLGNADLIATLKVWLDEKKDLPMTRKELDDYKTLLKNRRNP